MVTKATGMPEYLRSVQQKKYNILRMLLMCEYLMKITIQKPCLTFSQGP